MKRNKKGAKASQKKTRAEANSSGAESARAQQTSPIRKMDRRTLLQNIGLGAGAIVLAGAGGAYIFHDISATARETDLSRIGNGTPAVVQIHDPNCPKCAALQTAARSAMEGFGEDELIFMIANIKTEEGRRLAQANNVPHITLLFLDGNGRRRAALSGVRSSDELKVAFQGHADRFKKR